MKKQKQKTPGPSGWRRGYKVVIVVSQIPDVRPEIFVSCSAIYGEVRYIPGRVTTPQPGCGPLCVFTTKKDARKFINYLGGRNLRMFHCTYTPSAETKAWNTLGYESPHFPPGTRLAAQVVISVEAE